MTFHDDLLLAAVGDEDHRKRNPRADWVGAATVGYVGPGDILSSSLWTAFWGLRAFNRATIGQPVVTLRRSSDNTTRDFVSTSSGVDQVAIASFQGGANLTIVRFFDQTGNGIHMTAPAQANEIGFTLNALNGKAVADNIANNINALYSTPAPLLLDTSSHSVYVVYNPSAFPVRSYETLWASFTNEFGVGLSDIFPNNNGNVFIKNEGHVVGATLIQNVVVTNAWHAVGGSINQAVGNNSFFNTDNTFLGTADLSGNPGTGLHQYHILADEAGNQFIGQAGEIGWLATLAVPWDSTQVTALIANARNFWGF